MATQGITAQREFSMICAFIEVELPKHFVTLPSHEDGFGVGSEFDEDDLVASFLMPYDAYQPAVGDAIVGLLNCLDLPWRVCGSFDLCEPFTQTGELNPSPRFWITKLGVTGEVDAAQLLIAYGRNLRKADGTPARS